MNLIQKGVCLILFLAAVFLAGICWVNLRAIDDLTARNEELSGVLTAIDLQAKKDALIHKEVTNAIKTKNTEYRNAIANYKQLLHPKDNHSTGGEGENSERMEARPQEQTFTGCPSQTESDLLDDTATMTGMVEYFRLKNYPTE